MPGKALEITGLKEVKRSLYRYGDRMGDRVIKAAMVEGAEIFKKQAKAYAPKKTGRLRRNIIRRVSKIYTRRKNGVIGYYITLRTKGKADNPKNAFYGRFVHDGTKYIRSNPFIRKAFEQQKINVIRTTDRLIRKGAARLARRERLR